MTEAEWWEIFSDFATKQWELTPRYNYIVRNDYLSEMKSFLYKKEGKLLEVGCGSGWVGLEIAKSGMEFIGIDTSTSQIRKAQKASRNAGLINSTFIIGTLSDLDPTLRFDSVLIHATLHHLHQEEIRNLLKRLNPLLKEQGRLYIYEPILSKKNKFWIDFFAICIFIVLWSPFWLIQKVSIILKIGPKNYRNAVKNGWTGLSPDEAPLDKIDLLHTIGMNYSIVNVKYWHAYSLALAMGCGELKPPFSLLAERVIRFLYWVDRQLMSSHLKDHLIGVWTWVSISAKKC